MECTVSKATILGMPISTLDNNSSKCATSLCLKMCLGTRLLHMPWIMDAWLPASENMWQFGSALAKVNKVESFATKHEVNRSAASFWCSLASSFSRFSWYKELPEMFLVPPAPTPCLSRAVLKMEWKSIKKTILTIFIFIEEVFPFT